VEEGLGGGMVGGMVKEEEWLEWGKVEEGLEWEDEWSGGMGKEEGWLEWRNGWGGGMIKEEEW